ncbi:hypothetical protein ACVMAJ_006921 [Bradyrhizobium sp. USDA 4448]
MDTDLANELFSPRDPFAGVPRFQRVKNALSIIGISKSKIYALVRAGKVRAVKIDKLTYIDLASVNELFKNAPQIAPVQHSTLSAEQLGLAEASLPAADIAEEGELVIGIIDLSALGVSEPR